VVGVSRPRKRHPRLRYNAISRSPAASSIRIARLTRSCSVASSAISLVQNGSSGFAYHPDAGLRATTARDDSGDIVRVDRNPAHVAAARWRLGAKSERRAGGQNKGEERDRKGPTLHGFPQRGFRALSINSSRPFTIDDSAHPGRSRDDSTSNVYFPYDRSSGM
jgi:hypothetical protein